MRPRPRPLAAARVQDVTLRTLLGVVVALVAFGARAHDVSADLSATSNRTRENLPTAGSVGVSLSGGYDFDDRWSAWLGGTYTRDLATKTAEATSPGSNVFLLSPGALWTASDHWSVTALGSFSPPVSQRSATTVTLKEGTATPVAADLVIKSTASSAGGQLVLGWASAGDSAYESAIDVTAAGTHYDVTQVEEIPNTLKGNALRAACDKRLVGATKQCKLINGVATPLWQGRVGATYTATLHSTLSVGLDLAFFLYDKDPTQVGYFSLVSLGRDLGSGVPVVPYVLAAKPFLTWRWEKASLKVSWLTGLYFGNTGTGNALSAKLTWKVTKDFRLSATLLSQADHDDTGWNYSGTTVTLGSLVMF